jgi:hypothetical protein
MRANDALQPARAAFGPRVRRHVSPADRRPEDGQHRLAHCACYYLGKEEYVRRGPPAWPLRVFVAPVVVASTLVLFGTGVYLLATHEVQGTAVGLHKASFVVWLVSTAVHVLARLVRMRDALRARYPGLVLRLGVVAVTVAAGAAVATVTPPGADHLQDRMSAQIGFDER